MPLHPNKHISFFLKLAYFICAIIGGYFFFKVVFPWTIPLLLVIMMSRFIERPVGFLVRNKVPRKIASAVCTLLYLTLFSAIIYLLGTTIITQCKNLISELPNILQSLPEKFQTAEGTMNKLFSLLPLDNLGLENIGLNADSLSRLLSDIKLPSINPSSIVNPIFKVAVSFPTLLLSTVFVFVGTFFLTSRSQEIWGFVGRQISEKNLHYFFELKKYLSSSVFGWIRTQFILVSITFVELLIGFSLMRLEFSFLLALVISVIDALPVFGAGAILLPWALFSLLTGDVVIAVSMCIMYAVTLIVRNSIEPKILGAQIGLHPFVTLLCIYFGYRLGGFGGMFLVPVTLICLLKLQDLGAIKFYK